jgi:hypothetical protein
MSGMLGSENKCIGPKHFELACRQAGSRIIAELGRLVGCAVLTKKTSNLRLCIAQVKLQFGACYLAPVTNRIDGTAKQRTCGQWWKRWAPAESIACIGQCEPRIAHPFDMPTSQQSVSFSLTSKRRPRRVDKRSWESLVNYCYWGHKYCSPHSSCG